MTRIKRKVFISISISFLIIFFSIFFLINQFSVYKLENQGGVHLGYNNFIMRYSFGFYANRLEFNHARLQEVTYKKRNSDNVIFSIYFNNQDKKQSFIDSISEMDELIFKQNLKNSILNFAPQKYNYYLVSKKFNQEEVFNLLSKLNLYMSIKSEYQIDQISENIDLEKYTEKNKSCSDFKLKKKSWYTENCKFEVKLEKYKVLGTHGYIITERFTPERKTEKLDLPYKLLYKYSKIGYHKFIFDIFKLNVAFFISILIFVNILIYLVIFNFTKFFNEKI